MNHTEHLLEDLRLIPEFNDFWTHLSDATREEITENIDDEFAVATSTKTDTELLAEADALLAKVKAFHAERAKP